MPDQLSLIVFAPVIGLAVYCLCHVVSARLIGGRNPYPALALGAVAGIGTATAITLATCVGGGNAWSDTLALTCMNTVAAFGFAFCYFNFVNLTVASLRIRILEELAAAGGWLARSTLLDRYGTGSVIELRLARLVRGGHLVDRNGRLYTGRLQFLLLARIFDVLRTAILGSHHTTP